MKFSDKLAKLRKANNLSQEQLADAMGVTRQSVSKWESGDSYPDMAKIIQLCKILNCNLKDIMDDGVMGDEPEKIETKEEKVNYIKKYFDKLLSAITKTVNMITHMRFKELLKMVIEMAIVLFVLSFFVDFAKDGVSSILEGPIGLLPRSISRILYTLTDTILIAASTIFSVIVFVQVFKIRYLDYYVTLTDENAKVQTEEKPIEENETPSFRNEKEPVVIIRDPKHSGSAFIDGLVSFFSLVLKILLGFIAIPIVVVAILSIAGITVCITKGGVIFNSSILVELAVMTVCIVALVFIYNVLFNRKQPHKIFICVLIVSLLMGGAGSGLIFNGVMNIKTIGTPIQSEMQTKNYILKDLKENDVIYVAADNVQFEIDENADDIKMEFTFPNTSEINVNIENNDDGDEYYYEIKDDLFTYKALIDDIEKNQIHKSYNSFDYLKVKITCNSKDKEKFKQFVSYDFYKA